MLGTVYIGSSSMDHFAGATQYFYEVGPTVILVLH